MRVLPRYAETRRPWRDAALVRSTGLFLHDGDACRLSRSFGTECLGARLMPLALSSLAGLAKIAACKAPSVWPPSLNLLAIVKRVRRGTRTQGYSGARFSGRLDRLKLPLDDNTGEAAKNNARCRAVLAHSDSPSARVPPSKRGSVRTLLGGSMSPRDRLLSSAICRTTTATESSASEPTEVTMSLVHGTVITSTLDLFLLANDPFVLAYPCLRWNQHAATSDIAARASLPQYVFIRVFLLRHDIGPAPADLHAARTIGPLEATFLAASWSRWLTELATSGLLTAGPFHNVRDSDAAMAALTIANPEQLAILASDYGLAQAFDRPGITQASAPDWIARRTVAVPGPALLKFLDLISLEQLSSPRDVSPLAAYCRLAGALGPCYTRAIRADVRSSIQLTAMILRTQVSKIAGNSGPLAPGPASDALLACKLAPAIRAAYDALADIFAVDELTSDGFQREMHDAFVYLQGTDADRAAVITRRLPQRVALTQWEHDCGAADHLEAAWAAVAEGLGVDRDPVDVLTSERYGHIKFQIEALERLPAGTRSTYAPAEADLRQRYARLRSSVPTVYSLCDGMTQTPAAVVLSPVMWLGVGTTFWRTTFWRVSRPPPPPGVASTYRGAGAALGTQHAVNYGADAATQTSHGGAVAGTSVSFEASSPMPPTLRELARERVLSICRALREQLRVFSAAPVGIPSVEARRGCEVAARLYGTAVLGVERLVSAWPGEPEAATIPLPRLSLTAVPLASTIAPGPPSPWPAAMLAVEREDPVVDCGPLPWGNEVLRFTSPKLFVVSHLDDDDAGRTREATDAQIVGVFYGDWRLQVVPLVKKLFTKAEVAFDYQVLRNSTKRVGTMEAALAHCQRLGIDPIFRGPVSFGEVSTGDALVSGESEGETDESSEAETIESDPSSCLESDKEVEATPSVTIHRDSVPSFHVVAVPSRDDAVPGVYYGTWGAPDFLARTFTAFEQHYCTDTLVLAVDAADRLGAPLFFRGPRRHPDVPASGHLHDVPRSAVVPGERQWFSVCYEDGTARVVGFRRSQVVETAEFVARTRHDGHMQAHGYGPLAEAEARQRASRQAEWWTQLGGPGAKRQREEAQAELDAVCEAWEERTLDAALSTYVCARSSRRLCDAWLLWRDSARGRRLRLELMGRARCHYLSAAFAAWCMAAELYRSDNPFTSC